MKNFLQGSIILAASYFIFVYNDTENFQSVMSFIFSSSSYSPSENWMKNRVLILSSITILLLLYYHSVWKSYRELIQLYRDSQPTSTKPPLSAQQASYIYLQKDYLNLSTWLLNLCLCGILKLHYKKDANSWSISRSSWKLSDTDFDNKLLDIIFKDEKIKAIKDSAYNPDPQFEKVSKSLYKKIRKDNQHLLKRKRNSFLSWLLAILFLAELPSMNTLYPDAPGLVAIGFMLSLSTAFLVYSVCYQLPSFYNKNRAFSSFLVIFGFLIAGLFHWGGLDIHSSVPWYPTYFFCELIVVIAVAVYAIPQLPNSPHLLSNVIGYLKHLQETKKPIKEDDLPWLIGLDIGPIFSSVKLDLRDNRIPDWLKTDDTDIQEVINILNDTFSNSVNCAVNGRRKSSPFSKSDHSSMGKKY